MTMSQRTFGWLTLMLLGVGTVGAITSSYLPVALPGSTRPIADSSIMITLYVGLFAFVLGLGVLTGYLVRYQAQKTIFSTDHWPVFRQASLISIAIVAAFVLQGMRVLSWWDGILLVIALVLVELSFRARITGS